MKAQIYSLLICFLFVTNFSQAQEEGLYIDSDVLEKIKIEFLPDAGSYITIQVAAYEGASYESNFFSTFILLNPVFIEKKGDWNFISLGIFNSVSSAELILPRIKNLFWDAFLVAYKNGEPISLDEFTTGNAVSRAINIDGAVQRMKAVIETAYYRVRTGYYRQPGLEGKEKKMYKKLAKAGITFIEEPYSNGRIYVTTEKFTSIDDAYNMLYTIMDITGKEAVIQPYYQNIGINLDYLNSMYWALSNN